MTSVYLELQQIERLKALRDKTGAPVAVLIRKAVDEYLRKQEKKR